MRILAFTIALIAAHSPAFAADEPVEIDLRAVAGLRFDPPRFHVAPGARVKLTLSNADDMAHNLVLTKPDARMEIVTAAMAMPITPEAQFIPASDKVLAHIGVLTPGQEAELEFTAPGEEGVYPYVCTYPGHGLIMYGAMYVAKKSALPPLAQDPHLPELWREQAGRLHAFEPQRPYLYRTFLRDSGPASIAVALPPDQNFCWDAGACRLRYVWRGGFIDPRPHWTGNGDAFAEVKGRIYYRAGAAFPLRLGRADRLPTRVQFHGYRLVARVPEFHYEVDGLHVRELIRAPHHGSGLERAFTIAEVKAPVFFVAEPEAGATFASSAGKFAAGVLALTAAEAREFTVTMTEIPGREPLGYWSMDDVLTVKKPVPVEGVKGRAVSFDGRKAQHDAGVKTDALAAGGTFAVWTRLAKPAAQDQCVIGAKTATEEFALGANLDGATGFGVWVKTPAMNGRLSMNVPADGAWHHLAATCGPDGFTFYLDGSKAGIAGGRLPAGAPLFLGSQGGARWAAATLDEARLYDRILSDEEIRALAQTGGIKP
jgi:azurin